MHGTPDRMNQANAHQQPTSSQLRRVSFVIPVRNDARRLEHCLQSIRRNDYPRELVEIIVVDNGSTDDVARVAQESDAFLLQASTGCVADLRNRGVHAASGDILAFVDADHEIADGWISRAVSALSEDGVAAAGAPCFAPRNANWVQRRYDTMRARVSGRRDVDWLGSGNLVMKRAAFEAVGGFDGSLESCEDVDLCNRLRLADQRIVADSELRNVHFGDPTSLRAVFFGELWRGRNNLRVTLRGPWTIRHLRSAVIPVVYFGVLVASVAAVVVALPAIAAAAVLIALGLTTIRAIHMARHDTDRSATAFAQSLLVAGAYDLGRALAVLAAGTHHLRRRAGGE